MNRHHIRIGNQTAISSSSIAEPFRYAIDNGFDAFEWLPDKKGSGEGWSIYDIGGKSRSLVKKMARDHDISISVHAPWQINPIDPDAHKELLKHLAFARDVGASLLNIHLYAEEGIDAYIRAIRPLVKHVAEIKMRLSIENTPLTGPHTVNELFERLRQTDSETAHVGMCLDPGHANLCQETLNDYLKFVDMLNGEVPITHLHLHENYGDSDGHIPIFCGPSATDDVGIRGLLDRLVEREFSGVVILEQWPQPPSLLNAARDKLLDMLNGRHWVYKNIR